MTRRRHPTARLAFATFSQSERQLGAIEMSRDDPDIAGQAKQSAGQLHGQNVTASKEEM